MKTVALLSIFTLLLAALASAQTNINFNFAGMIPQQAPPEASTCVCPSSSPTVCPATSGLLSCDNVEDEAEPYFTYDTNISPEDIEPEFYGLYRPEADEAAANSSSKKRGAISSCMAPISYFGGPIMAGPNVAYIIYYGGMSSFNRSGVSAAANATKALLAGFLSSISNTAWYNISTEYYSRMAARVGRVWVWETKYVPSTMTYGGDFSVNPAYKYGVWNATVGKWFINSSNIALAIMDTMGGPSKISDNAMYFFVPGNDVYTEGSCGYGVPNFQGAFCAYHSYWVVNTTVSMKYAFITNPANNTRDLCTMYCSHEAYFGVGSRVYPNERSGDSMASMIAHELTEMLTDPVWAPASRAAWLDQYNCENADMCSWTYGPTLTSTNGGQYNTAFGGRQWLIQRNWVMSKNDCGMSL